MGDLGGCYNEAVLLENGRGTPRDGMRAAALYRRVCTAGSSAACGALLRLEAAAAPVDSGTY